MTVLASDRMTARPLPVIQIDVCDVLDASTLMRFSEQLDEAVSLDPEVLVVDLSRCPYMDAQAIRVLMDAHRTIWVSGGRLTLRGVSADTLRLLSVAGLADVFAVESCEQPLSA